MSPPSDVPRGRVLRRAALVLFAVLGPLGAIGAFVQRRDAAAELRSHEQDGQAVVALQAEAIGREVALVESDLSYLLHQVDLTEFLEGRPGSRERLESGYVTFSSDRGLYDQIRLIDEGGREVIRVNYAGGEPVRVPAAELQLKATRDYVQKGLQLSPGEFYVSPLDLDPEQGRVEQPARTMMRFAAPIFDRGGTRRGIIALNYIGRRLLQALADTQASFRGSLLLLNGDGFYLRGPRPADQFVAGHDRAFESDHPEAWLAIAGREGGQFHLAEGLFTFGTLRLGPAPRDALSIVAWVPPAVLYEASRRSRERMLFGALLLFLPAAAGAWYVAQQTLLRQSHERRIAESEARLRKLSAELLSAQERERSALSRDLHDDLGQLVTSITLDLERARESRDERQLALIGRALEGARQMLSRLHEIVSRVRPRILDELGLHDAVRSHLAEFEDRTGIAVSAQLKLDDTPIPPVLSENVYRILQEALINVSKHASSPSVRVLLRASPDALELSVADVGRGFDPNAAAQGLGLLGMRERVELLGGRLTLRTEPGRGTEIDVVLPIRAPIEG